MWLRIDVNVKSGSALMPPPVPVVRIFFTPPGTPPGRGFDIQFTPLIRGKTAGSRRLAVHTEVLVAIVSRPFLACQP
jgi:hypothetical protein